MLKRKRLRLVRGEGGDTLIEVTLALAILGFVLLSATAIAAAAYRTGQTARERTQVAAAAQEQLEALRSFRDNHTWNEFRGGKNCNGAGGYCGIDQVQTAACQRDATKRCFHMELLATSAGTTEWVPRPAGKTLAAPPTAVVEIATNSSAAQCRYDFTLYYQFQQLGGGVQAKNQIVTRLANLKFDPAGGAACPL